ncbi:hypothetical protein DSCA_58050 [Desulfosarcina alkanivorans]|uniref:Uncharacterized protein n=1 Tax=Desulfosarcina alkanivorans TaxID=571177 RepID=A0A5K7YTY9_9BACT|nr:hypothetical protein [Desulfosarcina alkanivorans]BBO71875.1 hypothetical protein DSCA_58050 [Desulfosarcina alkanivorans]
MIRLDLRVDGSCTPLFSSLFEKGVVLSARTGCTLREFLCGQLGIDDDYLDQRVQTLFLDARPVDDVDTAMVRDGATLALSAAMPGLLGATMRKGGRYAAFRKDISQPADACGACESTGRVTVKLFNMVAREVGSRLLETGVEVHGRDLQRIAERFPDELTRNIRNARVDDGEVSADMNLFSSLSSQWVLLSVVMEQGHGR